MATINLATSQNLSAVTYATGDIINVNDGVTLTINSQWATKPYIIQALGTGRIEVSNSSTTTLHLQEFYMQNGLNAGGWNITQNGVLQVRGGWITVRPPEPTVGGMGMKVERGTAEELAEERWEGINASP